MIVIWNKFLTFIFKFNAVKQVVKFISYFTALDQRANGRGFASSLGLLCLTMPVLCAVSMDLRCLFFKIDIQINQYNMQQL